MRYIIVINILLEYRIIYKSTILDIGSRLINIDKYDKGIKYRAMHNILVIITSFTCVAPLKAADNIS
jgi:ethanolamine utilization protein EutA (predicted chaperonin)